MSDKTFTAEVAKTLALSERLELILEAARRATAPIEDPLKKIRDARDAAKNAAKK